VAGRGARSVLTECNTSACARAAVFDASPMRLSGGGDPAVSSNGARIRINLIAIATRLWTVRH